MEELDKQIIKILNKIMSRISDFQAAVQANFDKVSADLDSISTDIAALNKLITDLQNSAGTLTPQDQASLDAIQAAAQALATKADAAVPPPLPTPPV